jgi:hypothetical protein
MMIMSRNGRTLYDVNLITQEQQVRYQRLQEQMIITTL